MESLLLEKNGNLYFLDIGKNEIDSRKYRIFWNTIVQESNSIVEYKECYKKAFKKIYSEDYDLEYKTKLGSNLIFSSW